MRELLEQVEASAGEPVAAVAYLAAQSVVIDEHELRSARRRALLLLAAGGDPRRELGPDDRAVAALADDLDTPERRDELENSLAALAAESGGLPGVARCLAELRSQPELAWRWLALALLAEELADDV